MTKLLVCILIFTGGCGVITQSRSLEDCRQSCENQYAGFEPSGIKVSPLSSASKVSGGFELNIYIELEDSYGSNVKHPGIFRIEAYRPKKLSAVSKAERIFKWDDIKAFSAKNNNSYWRDMMRSYSFNLKMPETNSSLKECLIEVTFISETGMLNTQKILQID
ncbi:hypothetical protein L21SP3_00538 [Sedimentisphaera cyanobacteriorum]|uniref:Uncharacterized protein n=1 Tax=Sedimentisphaera cyanobacteriorum TaxID=1940790 RepID=A0A1Q2HMU5_9BACT|nr:hypothetical protein [Sedimentisphaera cyanobacteriorum]AQQ08748.1 hypothetical protein L21SP3_00538 [Sedimentisphaera cyanobacteriorum]